MVLAYKRAKAAVFYLYSLFFQTKSCSCLHETIFLLAKPKKGVKDMTNVWEFITKHREIPRSSGLPNSVLDFVNGKRDQSTVLAAGIAVAHLAKGDPLAALAAKGQAEAIEKLLKKINVG